MALLGVSASLVLSSFKENLIYFYTLEDLSSHPIPEHKKIRVGGLVQENSIQRNQQHMTFVITDSRRNLKVEYEGMVPSLFRDGQGVIAEGMLHTSPSGEQFFTASQILAKHDENYMPKEVADQLKKSGHWKYNGQAK